MEIPVFFSPVSSRLSSILDTIGVNEELVQKRRETYLCLECHKQLGYEINNMSSLVLKPKLEASISPTKVYYFGSQIEGTTTLGMESDIDILYCDQGPMSLKDTCAVFKNSSTPPGYCRMLIKNGDSSLNTMFVFDSKGNNFIPNAVLHPVFDDAEETFQQKFKHGPASFHIYVNTDFVTAEEIRSLPTEYRQSLERFRSCNSLWPSELCYKKMRKAPCFLVPTGHPVSEYYDIEWRISSAMAERILMLSLNITQVRCLVLLKMLKNTFFETLVGNSFTSYHCKMVLLHSVKNTRPSIWRSNQLIDCLHICLSTLAVWLDNKFCPHIFYTRLNLFSGKMCSTSCRILSELLRDLTVNKMRCILSIHTDDIGKRLSSQIERSGMARLGSPFLHKEIISSRIVVGLMIERNRNMDDMSSLMYNRLEKRPLRSLINTRFTEIIYLLMTMNGAHGIKRTSMALYLQYLCSKLAMLLAAYRIKKKQVICQNIINLFRIGFHTDVSSNKLKLASALYCNGQFDQSLEVLSEMKDMLLSNSVSVCFSSIPILSPSQLQESYVKGKDKILEFKILFSSCVRILTHEVRCCPKGIRFSVLRPGWWEYEIDSKSFFYYLEYLVFKEFGRERLKTMALENLIRCANPNPSTLKELLLDIITRPTGIDKVVLIEHYMYSISSNKECDNERFHSMATNFINRTSQKSPFGSTGQCIKYGFEVCSHKLHVANVLNIIGYCFELENQSETAASFYWMSLLCVPSPVFSRQILRVNPSAFLKIFFLSYLETNDELRQEGISQDLVSDLTTSSRSMAIKVLPNIGKAIVHTDMASRKKKEMTWEEIVFEARVYVSLLNEKIRADDEIQRHTWKYDPPPPLLLIYSKSYPEILKTV